MLSWDQRHLAVLPRKVGNFTQDQQKKREKHVISIPLAFESCKIYTSSEDNHDEMFSKDSKERESHLLTMHVCITVLLRTCLEVPI